MPHFVNETQRYFLSTNYKVLYSLLYYQPTLQIASKERLSQNGWRKRWAPFGTWPHFLLVRNPYQRLESFYKDKFRQDPMHTLRAYTELQRCQRFFCPYLHIEPSDAPITIREKLLSVSFAQFVQLLPEVYLFDEHLHPQVYIMTSRWHCISFQFKFNRILQVESAHDLAYLQDKLGLDVSQKYNHTEQVVYPTPWPLELCALVNQLYKADFVAFNYEMRTG